MEKGTPNDSASMRICTAVGLCTLDCTHKLKPVRPHRTAIPRDKIAVHAHAHCLVLHDAERFNSIREP